MQLEEATLLPATVGLGLSPYLGLQGSQTSWFPSLTGGWPHLPTRLLSPRPLMPLLDPDSRLLVLAGKVSEKLESPPMSTHVGPQGWCLHLPGLAMTFDLSSQLGEWGMQDAISPESRN